MDTRIPLMGQPVDFAGSYSRGLQLAQQQNQVGRENALASLYQQQGPQIASGDPAALNALAGIDPAAALGVQQTRQGMESDQERLRLARDAGQREAQRMAAQATAEQVATEAEKGRNLILQGTAMYEAWTAGDQGAGLALNSFLQQNGIQGDARSFPQIMAVTAGALDTFSQLHGMRPKPTETFRAATPEEAAQYGAAAGQIDQKSGRFYPNNPPSGMSLTTGPDGAVTFAQGPGVAQRPLTEAQGKDVAYSTRARGALQVLDPEGGASIADSLASLPDRMLGLDPTGLVRSGQSDQFQVAKQAADEFLQAILRKDTGAAITAGEQELYGKTYLPQPGDNPAVLAAKKAARARALSALEAGMSADQIVRTEKAIIDAAKRSGPVEIDGFTIEEAN